jgi:DNA-binding Lrp family transcriptional regulator
VTADQEPSESWWEAIDDAVLGALAEAHGPLTLVEIAARVRISEDAARSVVAMLAEQGKVRIVTVELSSRSTVIRETARSATRYSVRAPPSSAPHERSLTAASPGLLWPSRRRASCCPAGMPRPIR